MPLLPIVENGRQQKEKSLAGRRHTSLDRVVCRPQPSYVIFSDDLRDPRSSTALCCFGVEGARDTNICGIYFGHLTCYLNKDLVPKP